ncbi:hypothetical protein [Dehalogenimonas etheniformans]|uniref:CARDB domain-containing protein n=1 Tax=Dehalogenimonas etheniformans TaxID=1536648 RepID=A0A2P5PA92_9CHLR|nr:hypothetical protein [Dehalogenimonas etheniformans]PPD59211.1 hypothetical protein JP09_000605 [Dehalogenimonas etheniformans]QNT75746.1 hypothetical protein HX448_03115 [Dehalogenimonas etheniformans]
MQYHSGDKYATPATESKATEYNVRGFPSMYFNGGNLVMGGTDSSYAQQRVVIERELAKPPAVAIVSTMKTGGGITVTATVTNISAAAVTNAKFYVVLFEDLGFDEHYYTVRDIPAPVSAVNLAPGESRQFNISSAYSGTATTIKAVVYLKASNGEILQATLSAKS